MTIEQIAELCHETNRMYCRLIGDNSQMSWDEAAQWQRDSAVKGVEFALKSVNAGPSIQHDAWLKDKLADGWKYGSVKDAGKKEHPCCVPYHKLPEEQKAKDVLFMSIVAAVKVVVQ